MLGWVIVIMLNGQPVLPNKNFDIIYPSAQKCEAAIKRERGKLFLCTKIINGR